ncbi:RSC complex subunit Rsc7 [Purpureocillium lavendulum]|uniref:RSC complex subunit Rsc7 n=1 Tax=Purpureocillium lavendulum TaxID=1247861 RepID=A0AB34G275_9HYPO|nr:RSC complex subunit Rsc7 [Purpureocillium lavendulum]
MGALHTLSELNEAGDEYLPAKIDRAGEKKVQPNGQLLDGRSYRVQTFTLPKRGDTLFMTEIECAKALGYRDISSLFNDNPTLYKVVADHDEKDHLIRYGILSHSDRDMEVAIVTAKSMFRCFGCQIIENGRRVRDDYWEKNAIKDGYTEEDIPPHPRRSQGTSTSRTRGESSVAKDSPTDDESAKLSEAQVSGGTARVWTTDLSDQTLTRVENRRWSRHVERISFALVEATGVKKWVERALQKYSLPELVRLTKPLLVIADEARSLDRELQFRKAAPGGLGSYMAEFGENLATHFWAAALAGTAMRLETTSPYYHDWKSLVRSSEFLVKNLRRKRMRDHYRSRAAGTIQEAHILKKFPGLDIGGPASSEWFAFLTRRLRREFYFNEAGRMAEIERCVKDSLSVQNPDICPSCCITPSNEPDSQAQKSIDLETSGSPLTASEDSCWLPLFNDAAIAYGFPIPERGLEMGIEMSVDLMAALAGVRHAVEYQGSVVLKGFSTILLPVKKNANTVQWHLIRNVDDDEPISYKAGISQCKNRVGLDQLDAKSLRSTRAIIGWCSTAETNLGSPDYEYPDIDYSKAAIARLEPQLEGGSFGFQHFAMARVDFKLGRKDIKYHYLREGPYRTIVSAAERTSVALYDTTERRGWLVPATAVLLHIAQHRHFLDNGQTIPLETKGSAKERLLENCHMRLAEDEPYTLRDLINEIWSMVEFLIARTSDQRHMPGRPMNPHIGRRLGGFEYKAIVEQRSPLALKEWPLRGISGGWVSLVEDIDALVLFASGFGNVMRPRDTDNQSICHKWRSLPSNEDYLAASGSVVGPGLLEVDGAVIFGATGSIADDRWRSEKSKPEPFYSQPNLQINGGQELQSEGSSCDFGVDQESYLAESPTRGGDVAFPQILKSSPRQRRSEHFFRKTRADGFDICGVSTGALDDGVSDVGDDMMVDP